MTALIAVEHHPDGLTTGFPCHFQCFHGEPAVRRERHGPAHWFSCEQVENNGEVRPALTRPDIGHITAPHLIWLGHGELPFKVVKGHAKQVDAAYAKECALEGMARTQVIWLKEGVIKA